MRGVVSTFAVIAFVNAFAAFAAGTTERVSVSTAGVEADGENSFPSVSADGRFVTFYSLASNLVENDTNNSYDTFLFDRLTGVMERVSVSSGGEQGNSVSGASSVSADGRFVAFNSFSSNLVPDDTNGSGTGCGGCIDVFVRDRLNGTTERVSLDSGGIESVGHSVNPSISGDGRYVAFSSVASTLVVADTNGSEDIFVRDRQTGITERVSVASGGAEGNGHSVRPSISADGRYVAFGSLASNLVADDSNSADDVFVHDRQTGVTERVTLDSSGVEASGPSFLAEVTPDAISADGRYVVFMSYASNLAPGDTGNFGDIFIRDRQNGTTERVSVDANGAEADSDSGEPSISLDGRYVAFHTFATNLVENDSNGVHDIFLHDRQTGIVERVSVDSAGAQGNEGSVYPSVDAGGNVVTFMSFASNLVSDDTNSQSDVFVRDLASSSTPSFVLSPATVAFGAQVVNVTSAAMTVTFTNTGSGALTIAGITRTGPNRNQFAHTTDCGLSVPEGTSCSIQVTFRPTSAGFRTASLNVEVEGGAGIRSVVLSGTGVTSSFALTAPPESLDFGDQPVGTSSAPRAITVTNIGSVPLPITGISRIGAHPNQFVATHSCGSSLPAGASCTIDVIFRPTTVGAKSASIRLNAGGGAGAQSIGVSGNGIAPTFTLSPASVDFPDQAVSVASGAQSITLTNTSALDLPITGISRTGAHPNQFTAVSGCGASVPAGGSCTIDVTFRPSTAGLKSAAVRVNPGAGAAAQSVALSGNGVMPSYSTSPGSLVFGAQPRNTSSAPQAVTVTNTGSVQLPITSITLNGTNPGQFSQTNDCGTMLAAGASCNINVVFSPTNAGSKSAIVRVRAGGGAEIQNVALTGTGT
jgi:Tol biopolymer transport system component